ncbi:hypothetical protein XENOCAPTIV_017136 [Xenoophorus captivus]|uniref:MRN complex-interacting protein N-terminal domain-containing protein n=1 Tax=Xenoophorus captivus TaxID=1517983 RepID=A0ABV0QSA5_9TELE
MVQEFHVVRCFRCLSFQVQQVKKVKKWSCKLCGEKQSLLKEFGRGSGADCRRHVQKLNAMRGAMMEDHKDNTWSLWLPAFFYHAHLFLNKLSSFYCVLHPVNTVQAPLDNRTTFGLLKCFSKVGSSKERRIFPIPL